MFRVKQSGDVFQFRMYVKDEQKHYRKSLRTKDLETALIRGRELGMELSTNVKQGKKVFGMTVEEGVKLYLEDREKDIGVNGGIVKGRWTTIRSQLKHFMKIVGKNTKVAELDRSSIFVLVYSPSLNLKRTTSERVVFLSLLIDESTIRNQLHE